MTCAYYMAPVPNITNLDFTFLTPIEYFWVEHATPNTYHIYAIEKKSVISTTECLYYDAGK